MMLGTLNRGMGDAAAQPATTAPPTPGGKCNLPTAAWAWWESLWGGSNFCTAAAQAPTPALPGAPPPAALVGPSCPVGTSLADGSCSLSGYDSSGNPIYVAAYQGTQYQAGVVNSVTSAIQSEQNQIDSSDSSTPDCSWTDTTGVFNNLFNPSCGVPYGLFALGLVIAISFVGGKAERAGRGR